MLRHDVGFGGALFTAFGGGAAERGGAWVLYKIKRGTKTDFKGEWEGCQVGM